ncbi:TetR/AcrR family transcriptional regulator [Pendulispora brunnea]|uniref:TetR/AcrR family transcriptional regulator n=1 Tax=Pendulispora brunnea TaxID=2905690 RepID=A0ABZ2KGS5_9BACT
MARTRAPKRKEPGEYHHGDLRRALLEAALTMVVESGPESFSVREAARRVGVDHRAAYRHFADKATVLAELAQEGYERIVRGWNAVLAELPEEDVHARLLALGRTYIEFAYREPGRYRVMTGPRLNEEGRFPELEIPIDTGINLLKNELRVGMARGALREADVAECAITLWSAMHGLASSIVMRRIRVRKEQLAAFAERTFGCTVRGLEK